MHRPAPRWPWPVSLQVAAPLLAWQPFLCPFLAGCHGPVCRMLVSKRGGRGTGSAKNVVPVGRVKRMRPLKRTGVHEPWVTRGHWPPISPGESSEQEGSWFSQAREPRTVPVHVAAAPEVDWPASESLRALSGSHGLDQEQVQLTLALPCCEASVPPDTAGRGGSPSLASSPLGPGAHLLRRLSCSAAYPIVSLKAGDGEFQALLDIWFPEKQPLPTAFLVDTSEEALLLPDWLKLRMIRSEVPRLVDAGTRLPGLPPPAGLGAPTTARARGQPRSLVGTRRLSSRRRVWGSRCAWGRPGLRGERHIARPLPIGPSQAGREGHTVP